MKLRGVSIKHWACIDSLELTDLHDGIIVLHGPNQTGKSSLVEALRCCLFELQHNTTSDRLTVVIPRGSRAMPEVAVEFEIGGNHFRAAKGFSKNKEGYARLEQQVAGAWRIIEEGKQAHQKIREVIGAASSTSGLFQLLWLQQGEIRLPEKPDPDLTKSLEAVLGSLITGRDLDFKARLDKACERWFTPTMQDKKASPALALAQELRDAQTRAAAIEQQWTDAEVSLHDYEKALARRPELQRCLDDAERELTVIAKEREAVLVRQKEYSWAVENAKRCRELHEHARKRVADHDEAERLLDTALEEHEGLEEHARAAEEQQRAAEQTHADAERTAHDAEARLAVQQQNRAVLDDRQRLVTIGLGAESLSQQIDAVNRLAEECSALEQRVAELAAPTPERISELRKQMQRATTLRARIEAAEIHVVIDAAPALDVQVDGASIAQREHRFRQNAVIRIGELATIQVRRGQEDRDLESLAAELVELERSLQSAQVDPRNPGALDELVSCRARHDACAQELKKTRQQLERMAPDGMAALHAQREQKQAETQRVRVRRPELADWMPDQLEVDRLRGAFELQEGALRTAALEGARVLAQSSTTARHTREAYQAAQTNLHKSAARIDALRERVCANERPKLVVEWANAEERLTAAHSKVASAALTEADHAIEQRYAAALDAREQSAATQRENDDRLLELKTKLVGTEGLHQRRVYAEQAVNDLTHALEREANDAEAHRHLKELFERVRGGQVRRTVGPINGRVTGWIQELGLDHCEGLDFGERLLPSGFVSSRSIDGPIALARESYGTQEQLSILIRLAIGGMLAHDEPAVAILDDPLAHADEGKHRRMLELFARAVQGDSGGPHPSGPLQLIILTCHADRFDHLEGAQQIDLARLIQRARLG